jgi:hypothetical protein
MHAWTRILTHPRARSAGQLYGRNWLNQSVQAERGGTPCVSGLAMQKVEGSSPFIRSSRSPR